VQIFSAGNIALLVGISVFALLAPKLVEMMTQWYDVRVRRVRRRSSKK
jgi:hypothetical protein